MNSQPEKTVFAVGGLGKPILINPSVCDHPVTETVFILEGVLHTGEHIFSKHLCCTVCKLIDPVKFHEINVPVLETGS